MSIIGAALKETWDLAQAEIFRRPQSTSQGLNALTGTILPDDAKRYLATVARRLLIDDIRAGEVERAYLDVLGDRFGTADHLTPERIAEAVQLLHGILWLLDALPPLTRQAFLLRGWPMRTSPLHWACRTAP